jgi:hypothetical protein
MQVVRDVWHDVQEVFEVLLIVRSIERGRLTAGPEALLADVRARGGRCSKRDFRRRRRLQRVIRFVDRQFGSGPNCYRRALLEIAMDAGAAAEILHLGFKAGGGNGSGHAWLGPDAPSVARYDARVDT